MARVVINTDELEAAVRTMRDTATEYEALARRLRREPLEGVPVSIASAMREGLRRTASELSDLASRERDEARVLGRRAETAMERTSLTRQIPVGSSGTEPAAAFDSSAAADPSSAPAADGADQQDDDGRRESGFPADGSFQEKLEYASRRAVEHGLVITSTTGGTHAPGSYHYQGRAIDIAGPAPAMAAMYTEFAVYTPTELFYDPLGGIKHGQQIGPIGGHVDHVHVAF